MGPCSTVIALALLFALALAIFADLLFGRGPRVLGHSASDLFLQYYAWRDFGFRELAKGNRDAADWISQHRVNSSSTNLSSSLLDIQRQR